MHIQCVYIHSCCRPFTMWQEFKGGVVQYQKTIIIVTALLSSMNLSSRHSSILLLWHLSSGDEVSPQTIDAHKKNYYMQYCQILIPSQIFQLYDIEIHSSGQLQVHKFKVLTNIANYAQTLQLMMRIYTTPVEEHLYSPPPPKARDQMKIFFPLETQLLK